ncbi:MAG: hypothetical protein FJ315_01915 [SAR202 cluster bacterium]|nr:hypothetical protein [SAR202 cluster bacterium]
MAGTCSLVFVVFNTLFCLPSQEAQIRCFKNVAAHLAPGGVFLVEAFVPNLTRFALGQSTQTTHVGTDRVRLDVSRHDPVAQTITSQQVHISESGVKLYPLQLRYAWPSELDLMAQLAGLRLRHRVGGWQREPFTAESGHHVSMYEKL